MRRSIEEIRILFEDFHSVDADIKRKLMIYISNYSQLQFDYIHDYFVNFESDTIACTTYFQKRGSEWYDDYNVPLCILTMEIDEIIKLEKANSNKKEKEKEIKKAQKKLAIECLF